MNESQIVFLENSKTCLRIVVEPAIGIERVRFSDDIGAQQDRRWRAGEVEAYREA